MFDASSRNTAICLNCYGGIYRENETKNGLALYTWYHMGTDDKRCNVEPKAEPMQGTFTRAL